MNWQKIGINALYILGGIIAIALLVWLGYLLIEFETEVTKLLSEDKQKIQLEITKTRLQIATPIAVLIGVCVAIWRAASADKIAKTAIDQVRIANKSSKITEDGKITDRFSKAIELLGSDKIEIRLGGIYALDRIAKESKKDHLPIIKIFASYIREKSKIDEKDIIPKRKVFFVGESKNGYDNKLVEEDIYTISSVLRPKSNVTGIDLSNSYLRGVDFSGTNLIGVNLNKANLKGANLVGAYLTNSNLKKVNLEGADLEGADLEGSDLEGANLKEANLEETFFERAVLKNTDLTEANLIEAKLIKVDLRKADLTGANLIRASLSWASLHETYFNDAKLIDADLSGAILYSADLKGAFLTYARLIGTNLTEANLIDTDLTDTDLTGADLTGADLTKANLVGAKLTFEQLKSCKSLYKVRSLSIDIKGKLQKEKPYLFKKESCSEK